MCPWNATQLSTEPGGKKKPNLVRLAHKLALAPPDARGVPHVGALEPTMWRSVTPFYCIALCTSCIIWKLSLSGMVQLVRVAPPDSAHRVDRPLMITRGAHAAPSLLLETVHFRIPLRRYSTSTTSPQPSESRPTTPDGRYPCNIPIRTLLPVVRALPRGFKFSSGLPQHSTQYTCVKY